jgi:hypothetical protein
VAEFLIANKVTGGKGPVVEFSTEIDEDGDFVVAANGQRLLFISSRDGDLGRFWDVKVDGIETEEDGRIAFQQS